MTAAQQVWPGWPRVAKSDGSILGTPRRARRARRCDGHLVDEHRIEAGEWAVTHSLPPNAPDIGNVGWWRLVFCERCWPEGVTIPEVSR